MRKISSASLKLYNEFYDSDSVEFEYDTNYGHCDGFMTANGLALVEQSGCSEKVYVFDKKMPLPKNKDEVIATLNKFATKKPDSITECDNRASRLFAGDGYIAVTFGRIIVIYNGTYTGRYMVKNRFGERKAKINTNTIDEASIEEKMNAYCKEVTGLSVDDAINDPFCSDAFDQKSNINLKNN